MILCSLLYESMGGVFVVFVGITLIGFSIIYNGLRENLFSSFHSLKEF